MDSIERTRRVFIATPFQEEAAMMRRETARYQLADSRKTIG
jgi:hypothetical protein